MDRESFSNVKDTQAKSYMRPPEFNKSSSSYYGVSNSIALPDMNLPSVSGHPAFESEDEYYANKNFDLFLTKLEDQERKPENQMVLKKEDNQLDNSARLTAKDEKKKLRRSIRKEMDASSTLESQT